MSQPDLQAVILRGLPGSGKSTLARQIRKQRAPYLSDEECIFNTDQYFFKDNDYVFDRALLEKNHNLNFAAFSNAANKRTPTIICDNTNMQLWNFQRYMDEAIAHGYSVEVVLVGEISDFEFQQQCAKRNIHGVSLDRIVEIASKFEEYQ